MIKKWLERLPSRLPLTQLACTLVQTSCMQAEIDELRAENERLKSALLTNDTTIESANNAAGMLEAENARLKAVPMKYKRMAFNAELQAENARLRDALGMMVHAQSSILGLEDSPVVKFARAALGEKS